MDLGIFKARRAHFVAWLAVPPLLILAVHIGANAYGRWVTRELDQRRSFWALMPEMQRQLGRGQKRVALYALREEAGADAIETVSARFNASARHHGLTIFSLGIEKADGAASPGSSILTATLKAEGSFLSLLKFLNEMQAEGLASLFSAQLGVVRFEPEAVYEAEFVFECHVIST